MIDRIYNNANVLILVSDTEGFPMVVMEAMARGLAIVATAVGELPLVIADREAGFLITDYYDRDVVVQQSVQHIIELYKNRELAASISNHNIDYAYSHFGLGRFGKEYRELFQKVQESKT